MKNLQNRLGFKDNNGTLGVIGDSFPQFTDSYQACVSNEQKLLPHHDNGCNYNMDLKALPIDSDNTGGSCVAILPYFTDSYQACISREE